MMARAGFPCAAQPNLPILGLLGERMNAGAVDSKALKVRPQKENEPSRSEAQRGGVFLNLTAKIWSQTAQGERRFRSPLARVGECARSSRKGKTAHRAVLRAPLLVLCKKIRVNESKRKTPSSCLEGVFLAIGLSINQTVVNQVIYSH